MSFLQTIFSSGKKQKLLPDFSVVHTDMHSHLIPGIDDGAQSMGQSIEMVAHYKKLGFKKIITTPHIMSDYYKNTPTIINEGLDKLNENLKQKKLDIPVSAGAEYYIDFEFSEKLKTEALLPLVNNYILVEFSFTQPPENLEQVIFELQLKGYKIIIAHVERFHFYHSNFKKLLDLKDKEVYFQVNLLSLLGYYNGGVKKQAEKLIDNNIVDFVGSDAHNITQLQMLPQVLYNKNFAQLIKGNKLLNSKL